MCYSVWILPSGKDKISVRKEELNHVMANHDEVLWKRTITYGILNNLVVRRHNLGFHINLKHTSYTSKQFGRCYCKICLFLCYIIWMDLILRESSDNTVTTSTRSRLLSCAQPIFYWCCGAALCSKRPVWVLWIHRGLSLQLTAKYCIVMNRLLCTTVKAPATIVVNLFCCLQAWMERMGECVKWTFLLPLWKMYMIEV